MKTLFSRTPRQIRVGETPTDKVSSGDVRQFVASVPPPSASADAASSGAPSAPDFLYGPEEWRLLKCKPIYEISNYGRVRRIKTRKFRKPCNDGRYLSLQFWGPNGEHFNIRIQLLVLTTFVGERPEGLFCCHNDGNAFNNHISNLRWDTPQSNSQDQKKHGTWHHGNAIHNAKLSPEKALEIVRLRKSGEDHKTIAKRFGVGASVIYGVLRGAGWGHATKLSLRQATRSQVQAGRRVVNSKSGFKGVSQSRPHLTNQWRATIRVNGALIRLGTHRTAPKAAEVYDAAAIQHFGEFAATNKMLGLLP